MGRFRKERIASVVREIVSDAMLRHMHDPRLDPLTTITRVEVTGDLQLARVFLSVPGGDAVEHKSIAALHHAAGFIQRMLARELNTRHCPELRFSIDVAQKKARATLDILRQNRLDNPELYESLDEDVAPADGGHLTTEPPDDTRGEAGKDVSE